MGIMLVMLLIAMVPTGNYDWPSGKPDHTFPTPKPSDYAVCYFNHAKDADRMAFASIMVSVLLLGLGFVLRVIKLHKSLSVNIVGRLRSYVSATLRKWLLRSYKKLIIGSRPHNSLHRTMIYRPLLATFLAMRFGLDVWTSMFVEVCHIDLVLNINLPSQDYRICS